MRKKQTNQVLQFLLALALPLVAIAMAGCSSDDPLDGEEDFDNGYLTAVHLNMEFPASGGERAYPLHGIVGEDGIAVKCISTKEIGYFDNIFDYLDEDVAINVDDYCKSLGYEKYPNTPDFFVSYKWVEINTVKVAGERDGVITVRCSPNPYKCIRRVWVRLQNMKTSVMTITQDENPDGIDPTELPGEAYSLM